VMFIVKVFWVVTPCSIVVGYQHFRGPCCLHLQVEVFWVVTPCSVVVGYQGFRGPCCHFTGSGAQPAYPIGTRGSFPGGKTAGAWSWPLSSIQSRGQRKRGAIPPLSQYASMAWCSVKKARELNLYLYLTLPYLTVSYLSLNIHNE
jgi:hypothetical protein